MQYSDPFDEALVRFGGTGPEYGLGLSNHGPMAADALVAMGRTDAVERWTDWYVSRLDEHPQARNPIDDDDWREALGDIRRAGDWIAYFDDQLRERPWHDVLQTWTPRLAPGIMSGATHGILRTAHAVRALASGDSAPRVHELAEGLGYWAARYQELPGRAGAPGRLRVQDALPSVAVVDAAARRPGMIFEAVRRIDAETFAPVIDAVDVDDAMFVSDLTRTFVRHYLKNAQTAAIGFIHTVTAPSALRIIGPLLDDDARRATMQYAWQACAAIYSAFGDASNDIVVITEPVEFDEADLIDQAVAARDEHAIKFTDACLREYRLAPDPAFILAARDAVVRLRR